MIMVVGVWSEIAVVFHIHHIFPKDGVAEIDAAAMIGEKARDLKNDLDLSN